MENYLAKETHRIYQEPQSDLSHLEGRLGIDMHYLVTSYHGEGKNMRNQLSDKFDEVEQDFLSYHSLYSSLLCESPAETQLYKKEERWFDSYRTGTCLPSLS